MTYQVPVIDLEAALAGRAAERDAVRDAIEQVGLVQVTNHGIDPGLIEEFVELKGDRAYADEPSNPGRAIDNGVEGIDGAHVSTARPTTGVDGAAISRGSIGPARNAARPASMAWPKARAIATGSPAFATAVLRRMPS